ncbi:MAG: hypothetical protein HRT89_04795, partial [Lentisphaeria bacterium]|nr:hypothetical protein [Lentisphaeria bacterium]
YFWMAAHRVLPGLDIYPWAYDIDYTKPGSGWPGGEMAEAYGRVNNLFNKAFPSMNRLRVVEGGTHVIWLNDNDEPAVVWAFNDVTFEHEGTVENLETGEKLESIGSCSLAAHCVYFLCP